MTILLDGAENTPAAWTRRALAYPEPWTACGWSRQSQAARFEKILRELDPQPGESLLDYGCGTGDLCEWLDDAGSSDRGVWYTGIDWSLGMVARAVEDHPGARFVTQLRDGETWDLVVCCGPFNLADNWSKRRTWSLMRMLWARCERAMAVSLYYGSDPACIRYPASEVVATAAALSPRFSLERGYLPNDLLVVLRR